MDKVNLIKSWIGSSVVIEADSKRKENLIATLELTDKDYEYNDGEIEIYNSKRLLFFELEYLQTNLPEFEDFLKKYSCKEYSELQYYSNAKSRLFPMNADLEMRNGIYKSIIDNNNIITDGIVETMLAITPTLFKELNVRYNDLENLKVNIFNYMSELFSLFAIADKTRIINKDDDTFFYFTFFSESNKPHDFQVQWGDWDFFENSVFYDCYIWILDKYKESFRVTTILSVVRQYLYTLDNITSVQDITHSLESILNRIIKNETKEYFEQQNKLKDEFINYTKMELDARNDLMKGLLGLITTLGLAYYGKVILLQKFSFTDKNPGLAVIFIFGLIAIAFFVYSYIVKFIERKNFYSSLKEIYVNKFLFAEADFEDFLEEPSLFRKQWLYWITVLIFFILVLLMLYLYSENFEILIKKISNYIVWVLNDPVIIRH